MVAWLVMTAFLTMGGLVAAYGLANDCPAALGGGGIDCTQTSAVAFGIFVLMGVGAALLLRSASYRRIERTSASYRTGKLVAWACLLAVSAAIFIYVRGFIGTAASLGVVGTVLGLLAVGFGLRLR